jgi:NADH-quinone oxidoreductase subunit A
MSPTLIAGYLALFVSVGAVFLFVNLLVGRFLRPKTPSPEKLAVYECGEPTIGSSFVQFDLRFYVVALLFIIFDVEIAFFFPWATVYGKAVHLTDPNLPKVAGGAELTETTQAIYRGLGVANPTLDGVGQTKSAIERSAGNLVVASMIDIGVFFGVLMAGFAYVWRRGDLDWVRAVGERRAVYAGPAAPNESERPHPALVG